MSSIRSCFLLTPLLAVLGCAPSNSDLPSGQPSQSRDCLKITMTDGAVTTAPPAKVSLLFTVDTCGGEPVSGLTSDQFVISEDGKAVSDFESKKTVQPRSRSFRLYSLLLLDLSGSMLQSGHFPALRDAALLYVDRILANQGDGQRVAIASFDGRSAITPLADFTDNPQVLKDAINRLDVPECETDVQCAVYTDRKTCSGWLCVDDSTNLNGAVSQGLDKVELALANEPDIKFKEAALVVFTDGTDQASRVETTVVHDKVDESPAHVMTIGLGGEIDEGALKDFGKDGFQPVVGAEELGAAFDEIAGRILGLANRFYLLEYCSPKRSGEHEIGISVRLGDDPKSTKLQGTLTETFDATGFESGCQISGN